MILINGVAKAPAELERLFGIPLEKMKKSSEFAINEVLKGYDLGAKQKRIFGGAKFPATFTTEDKDGNSIEVIYAKTKTKSKDKDGRFTDVFSPKKVDFDGDSDIPSTIDETIFKYLHPKNRQSIFRSEFEQTPFMYEFVDKQAKATTAIKKGDVMLEALQHAKGLTGLDLRMIAKGLNVQNVDGKEELEIQAELSNLAMSDPASYLKTVGRQVTAFDGRIIDAIDKGLFILKDSFGVSKWEWNAGKNKGAMICEVTNSSIAPQDFLKNYIKSNDINSFHSEIVNLQTGVEANEKAEAFLSQVPKKEVAPKEIAEGMPTTFAEAVEYLTERDGKRPSNSVASTFLKEVKGEE